MIVVSLAGHDKQRVYLIRKIDGKYAWLADGSTRPLERMKRKSVRHLRPLGQALDQSHIDQLDEPAESGQKNALLRRILAEYLNTNPLKEEIR
ncbi:MAG: KOW domain-containing RNA-binding protein [Clostridiaceae bacterium]|nr:KOW domain-containing RNA-binding protein [Clostridiaceae bacterium]